MYDFERGLLAMKVDESLLRHLADKSRALLGVARRGKHFPARCDRELHEEGIHELFEGNRVVVDVSVRNSHGFSRFFTGGQPFGVA